MQIMNMKLSDIHPYEKESRFDVVTNSIKEFGWHSPIVVDKEHVIVCGRTRFKAAQKLGLEEAPAVVAADLTPEPEACEDVVMGRGRSLDPAQ